MKNIHWCIVVREKYHFRKGGGGFGFGLIYSVRPYISPLLLRHNFFKSRFQTYISHSVLRSLNYRYCIND